MPNELNPGDTRIGWLVDGDPQTPERAVGLRNTGDDIELEVPLDGSFGGRDPYARWFQGGIRHADDPGKVKFRYEPPSELLFFDADGSVALVGCHFKTTSLGTSGGRGVIRVTGAIPGARSLKYALVNGVRSTLPTLNAWTGITSADQQVEVDDEHRASSLRLSLSSPEPVRLDTRLNLNLRPSWRTISGDTPGHLVTVDEVRIETRVKKPARLDDHFDLHRAIRELLVVAAGRDVGFGDLFLHRSDDPERSLEGSSRGERWCPLITYRVPAHRPSRRHPEFIFSFADIGASGVRRWLKLRNRFGRGIRPLISVLDGKTASIESQLFTLGVALEAIGYESRQRGQLRFPAAIERVLHDIQWAPLRDTATWEQEIRAAYTGVKHADRPLPDVETIHRAARGARVVLRCWVASQLGATEQTALTGLRLSGEHALVPDTQ